MATYAQDHRTKKNLLALASTKTKKKSANFKPRTEDPEESANYCARRKLRRNRPTLSTTETKKKLQTANFSNEQLRRNPIFQLLILLAARRREAYVNRLGTKGTPKEQRSSYDKLAETRGCATKTLQC